MKALKNVVYKGIIYEKGDDIKIATKDDLIKLSEKGFIRPLTLKEIENFGKEPKKIIKKVSEE